MQLQALIQSLDSVVLDSLLAQHDPRCKGLLFGDVGGWSVGYMVEAGEEIPVIVMPGKSLMNSINARRQLNAFLSQQGPNADPKNALKSRIEIYRPSSRSNDNHCFLNAILEAGAVISKNSKTGEFEITHPKLIDGRLVDKDLLLAVAFSFLIITCDSEFILVPDFLQKWQIEETT